MSNKIHTADSESIAKVRVVQQSKDFLGGTNSQFPPNLNRHKQRQINHALRQTELSLLTDLKQLFIRLNLNLTAIRTFHNSPMLAKCFNIAKYTGQANGLTFIIFEFDNNEKLFEFSVCHKEDNFSRLEGRVYALRKAFHGLRSHLQNPEIPNYGLCAYPSNEKDTQQLQSSVTPFKIGNYIVKHFVRKPVVKQDSVVNPLENECEVTLLNQAKLKLVTEQKLDPDTIYYHSQYVRNYSNKLFNGLMGTPRFIKDLNDENVTTETNGGYTVFGISGINSETKVKEIFITVSRCSESEAFNKSYGRKQCLINFGKNNYQAYTLKQDVPSMPDALIQILETYINRPVNVNFGNAPSPVTLK